MDAALLFENAFQWLAERFGPSGPPLALAALGLVIALIALPFVLRRGSDPLRRFSFRQDRVDDDLVRLRVDRDDGRLRGLAEFLEPDDQDELGETRALLRAAGYRQGSAVRVYHFARAVMGLSMLTVGLIFALLVPEDPDLVIAAGLSGLMGLAGYFAPIYWVRRQAESRRQEISDAFPDAMDMMLICIESGQSLDQAIDRVGNEIGISAPALAEELQTVSQEFRAGKDRPSVLRDLADRCRVNDISALVTVLIQSSSFGTSISQAMRVYASEMRDKRLLRAEEKANVLPTKLTLGTMMFTVPPLILILVGPSVIQITRALSGLANGGGGG